MAPLRLIPALAGLAALVMAGRIPAPASGATLRVPSEYPTIQAGVDAGAFGDTVLVAPGNFYDFEVRGITTACVFMKDGVVLRSEQGPEVTFINAGHLVGLQPNVVIATEMTVALNLLQGFTLTNETRVFRGLLLLGTLRVDDCTLEGLSEPGGSGGGANINGDVIFTNCRFIDCHSNLGGSIYHSNGTLTMFDCLVQRSGHIGVRSNEIGGGPLESAWIEHCKFENCGDSGALSIAYFVRPATVRTCTFVGNVDASTGGGGLAMAGQGSKLVEGCLFIGNEATGAGGALKISRPATIRNNTSWGNAAYSDVGGSAVRFSHGGPYDFSNNVIAGGIGVGGALEAQFGGVNSACNVLWGNEGGAGVYFTPGPTDREVDPMFCNSASSDFTLSSGSPCLPEDASGCGLIGKFGLGCGGLSTDQAFDVRSWGAIKELWR